MFFLPCTSRGKRRSRGLIVAPAPQTVKTPLTWQAMKLISRTVWILSLVSLFTDLASELLYPVMPLYLQSIGFSFSAIGLLEGIAEFTAGLSKGYFGQWSDRIGRRLPFVRAGYFLSAFVKPLTILFSAAGWIFGMRTLDRIGKGVRTASRDAILSAEAAPGTKARVFSFHRSWDTVGAALGPLAALVFLKMHPGKYTDLFLYAALPGIVAVLLLFLLREKKQEAVPGLKKGFFSYFSYYREAPAQYKKLLSALLLFALANSSDVFLLLQIKALTGSDLTMILYYVGYNIVYAAMSYPAGFLADRWGMQRMLRFGLALFVLVYAGFALQPDAAGCAQLMVAYGIYAAFTEGISKAWITTLVPKEATGRAVGLFTSAQSIALFTSSLTAGILWDQFGAAITFGYSAIVGGLAILLIWKLK